MKVVLISGASSGIGLALTNKMLSLGYYVIGVSRTITQQHCNHENFEPIQADLSEEKSTKVFLELIKKRSIFILINCAGFGKFEPHEELNIKTITKMTFLNLTTPMLLTNTLLRTLKKNDGYLININSIEALRASKFAGVYSATKAGLKAFGDALFEETRRTNLSITNINPDMTFTPFYDTLRFQPTQNENEKLLVEDIVSAVEHILTMRKGAVVSEYTIRSLQFGIQKKKI